MNIIILYPFFFISIVLIFLCKYCIIFMMKRYYSVTSRNLTTLVLAQMRKEEPIMNTTSKLTSGMNIQETLIAMSEGNPGALTCMMKMIESNPMALLDIVYFDFLGIHGTKIYILWNDCCNRDMEKFNKTIQFFRENKISKEEIHANLDKVRAEPFI